MFYSVSRVFVAVSDDDSSDLMELMAHSDSDNEWMEESSDDDDEEEYQSEEYMSP